MGNPSKKTAKAAAPASDLTLMTAQRRGQITALVRDEGSVRVTDLAQRFGVSEVTIRTDLDHLEREGKLVRDRGGALPVVMTRTVTSLPGLDHRMNLHIEVKRRIAAAAARRVQAGQSLILDAGTTAIEMIPHLAMLEGLTIVTNALNVALAATAHTAANVILLGGSVGRDSGSTLGSRTEEMLKELLVDHLFLGVQAMDLVHGVTDTNLDIAQIKRAMIRSARRVTLLGDSSKWSTSGMVRVAPLTAAQVLITDHGLPTTARREIESLGLEVEVV